MAGESSLDATVGTMASVTLAILMVAAWVLVGTVVIGGPTEVRAAPVAQQFMAGAVNGAVR